MKILVIDNNIRPDCFGSKELARYGHKQNHATTVVRRGPHDDLPKSPTEFDRIIISGSLTSILDEAPWIANLEAFVRQALDRSVPLLGVCFGHQIIARAVGGMDHVRRAQSPEFGWTEIEVLDSSPIFEGLNDKFHSFSYHFEEVAKLPKGFRLTARSHACGIQSYVVDGKPAFGIQFHPEKQKIAEKETLADLKKRKLDRHFHNPGQGNKLYSEEIGNQIFGNFFKIKK